MIPVRMYTSRHCGYCVAARRLLSRRGIAFHEIDASQDPSTRAWLVTATGQRTVPQIFIGERSIGGYTELAALDRSGALKVLLEGPE